MAYTTINKSGEHFNTKLYTGTETADTNITGVGFQPDWVWIKNRDTTGWHNLHDAVRGAGKLIYTNRTNAERDDAISLTSLSSFNSDGFTVGNNGDTNGNGNNIASWNWKANGAGSANTDGSISSTVSANTTAGFSIVSYTGTNATGTVGHGLGATPKIVLYKNRTDVTYCYFTTSIIDGTHDLLLLPALDAQQPFSASLPTNSVLNLIANNDTNGSGDNIIAYCFAEKKGYSKFGSYVGNGNADGTFIYTGFKPAFVINKRTDSIGNWNMRDVKRDVNENTNNLYSNLDNAEASGQGIDFLSNGFKQRNNGGDNNGSGATYIYMAFAEAPLVGSNNVPCTAR